MGVKTPRDRFPFSKRKTGQYRLHRRNFKGKLTTPGERGGTLHPLQRTKSQNFSSWRKISVLGAAIIILITEGNEQRSWQTTYLIYEYVNNESTSTILFFSTRVVDWVPIDPSPTYSIPILLLFRRASPGVCEIMIRCSRHYHANSIDNSVWLPR